MNTKDFKTLEEKNIYIENNLLDDFEKEIMQDIENWFYKPCENQNEEKEKLYQAVRNTTVKKKAISIKPLESDIFKIKSLALEKWIPYQTFINSILHQVATGNLKV